MFLSCYLKYITGSGQLFMIIDAFVFLLIETFIIISGPAKNGLETSAGSPALQQNSSLNKYAGNDTFAVIYTF